MFQMPHIFADEKGVGKQVQLCVLSCEISLRNQNHSEHPLGCRPDHSFSGDSGIGRNKPLPKCLRISCCRKQESYPVLALCSHVSSIAGNEINARATLSWPRTVQ